MRKFGYFALSAGLHIGLLSMALLSPLETPQSETPFQVELIEKTEKPLKNIRAVQNSANANSQATDKAKLLSDKKRRVELETRKAPRRVGLRAPIARPRKPSPQPKGGQLKQQKAPSSQVQLFKSPSEILKNAGRKPLRLPFAANAGIPNPRIPQHVLDSLPNGIELGNITALNTDQHLFYNFNARLIESFAPLWGELVGRQVYRWLNNNSFPKVDRTWVTNVEVILDKTGEVLDIQHYRLSGLWPFDEAPVKAFQQMKKVPNPPQEMVDEDGYIRLKFQTEVHWRTGPPTKFNLGSGQRSY